MLRLPHHTDEADALAREGFDETLLGTAVADSLARRIDTRRQRRVRDDAPAPDRRDELVLADHPLALTDEIRQEIENLRLERNRVTAATQLTPVDIEHAVAERKDHRRSRSIRGPPDAHPALLKEKTSSP